MGQNSIHGDEVISPEFLCGGDGQRFLHIGRFVNLGIRKVRQEVELKGRPYFCVVIYNENFHVTPSLVICDSFAFWYPRRLLCTVCRPAHPSRLRSFFKERFIYLSYSESVTKSLPVPLAPHSPRGG